MGEAGFVLACSGTWGNERLFHRLQGALRIRSALAEPGSVAMVQSLKGLGGLPGLYDIGCAFGSI